MICSQKALSMALVGEFGLFSLSSFKMFYSLLAVLEG